MEEPDGDDARKTPPERIDSQKWADFSIGLSPEDARWIHDKRLQEGVDRERAEARRKATRNVLWGILGALFIASAPPWWAIGLAHLAGQLWLLISRLSRGVP